MEVLEGWRRLVESNSANLAPSGPGIITITALSAETSLEEDKRKPQSSVRY